MRFHKAHIDIMDKKSFLMYAIYCYGIFVLFIFMGLHLCTLHKDGALYENLGHRSVYNL